MDPERTSRPDAPAPHGPHARALSEGELAEALSEHFPGLAVIDHELDFGTGRGADLVARDASGRIVLIAFADGQDPASAQLALEALASARAHGPRLARLAAGRAERRAFAGASVALVCESCSTALLDVLAVVDAPDLDLFVLHELRSASAARAWLQRVTRPSRPAPRPPSFESFLAHVAPGERALAEDARRRLERLDAAIEVELEERRVRWLRGDLELGSLATAPDLVARSARGEARRLDDRGALERFLDEVVREYLRAENDGPGVEEDDPAGQRGEPLLSAEEIAAFHD
jgi:hypothetical protein